MPRPIQCSRCFHRWSIPDAFTGKSVTCPDCNTLVPILAQHTEDDDLNPDDARPRRKRRKLLSTDQSDEDDRPSSKRLPRAKPIRTSNTLFLRLGGVGGVVALIVCSCCGGLFFLGIIAKLNRESAPKEAVKWGESHHFGSLRVRIQSATLRQYSGKSPSGRIYDSRQPGIVIVVLIETDDKTKEHSANDASRSAKLRDTLGNTIAPMSLTTEYGFRCQISGQLKANGTYVVRSDDPLTDTLVFDKPVEAATTLHLTIDADSYGGRGNLVFEIPETAWKPSLR